MPYGYTRRKGNDGRTSRTVVGLAGSIRPSLFNALSASLEPKDAKTKPERKYVGVPKDRVLEVRKRHGWDGWTSTQIASHLGMKDKTVKHLLQYTTHTDLDPGQPPSGYKKEPAPV